MCFIITLVLSIPLLFYPFPSLIQGIFKKLNKWELFLGVDLGLTPSLRYTDFLRILLAANIVDDLTPKNNKDDWKTS